jgi:STE24 endopeptidase
MSALTAGCWILIVGKWLAQAGLERLNQRHIVAHRAAVPLPFRETISAETYARSVNYSLAKSRFHVAQASWEAVELPAVLFSGALPWFYKAVTGALGRSVWAGAGFIAAVAVALALADLPLDWQAQFNLEQRFGFNTTTPRLWWSDRLKGALLALGLGYPLLALILALLVKLGAWWWVWAWGCVVLFQLAVLLLAPLFILPLFNKFTPLPDGPLRDGLLALSRRADFRARDIQVMDGSKRSRHSNAFFTGRGRWRKIVLFDTLIGQLAAPELESVLAHEIGHFKLRHIPKALALSASGELLGFYAVSVLLGQPWFCRAFGFQAGEAAPALLLCGLLSGVVLFWLSPLLHKLSRRHEYQADRFAAGLIGETKPLVSALRKLHEKNLSNLTPHPFYSRFYYSHPTLLEREQALSAIRQ